MKRQVGLWIDHTKAIIVTVMGEMEETRLVKSNIEKYVHFSGGSHADPLYGTCAIPVEGKLDGTINNCFSTYFDGVVSLIRHADSIWIFGPGAAKGELEEHLKLSRLSEHIVGMETVQQKMSDRQVTAKVRQYYQE